MPVILLERIPLPSLRAYTGFSVVLLACAVFYAHQVVQTAQSEGLEIPVNIHVNHDVDNDGAMQYMNVSLPYDTYIWNMVYVMTAEAWCVWTLVNTAYCCLILLGKLVQKVVFGELRVSEQQHLKDKFWNFLFYKFIFVFGVMNVQTMEEVVLWVAWFTVLGFYHLLTQLAKDRFEYVSFSPTTPRFVHIKLLSLLCVIVISCFGLLAVCVMVGLQMGITIFAFMAAECMLLAIRTLYVVARYCLHLVDMNLEGVWENRATYIYYTELIFELAALSIDFGHHLHMLYKHLTTKLWVKYLSKLVYYNHNLHATLKDRRTCPVKTAKLWGNIFLSMASLVICMQLRYLFYEFKRRIKRHKNYRRVVKNMEERFSMATTEELGNNNDDCAVCWEKMETARKLPCGHLFHNSCLRSWLEQDTSCPTCRLSLNERSTDVDPNGNIADQPVLDANIPPANQPGNVRTNHFFHFDGSRYVSWLPSFSVEVTHTNMLANSRAPAIQTSQLDNMARQVLQVFPHMPLNEVTDDLRITRSVDFTIENILEGRLQAPPPGTMISRALGDDDSHSDSSDNYQIGAARAESNDPYVDFPEYFEMPNEMGDNSSTDSSDRSDTLAQFSGRFSKSANERESMLEERKDSMLEQARRRFLAKENKLTETNDQTDSISALTHSATETNQFSTSTVHSEDSGSEGLRQRRELAYMAATRRQLQGRSEDT